MNESNGRNIQGKTCAWTQHDLCICLHRCMCEYHKHTPTCNSTSASVYASVYYNFQGFQTTLLKRPGPEWMAQLKTLVTDDISRDQTNSVPPLPPIPQIVWKAQDEYLHGWMSFPYKPLTPQPLSWHPCRLSVAFSFKGPGLKAHSLWSLHVWICKIYLWVN